MKSVFGKMFISYLLIFILPLIIMGLLSYWWISNVIIDHIQQSYIVMINEVKMSMDNRFRELNNFAVQLSQTPWVKKLMYMQGPSINKNRISVFELNDHVMELRGYDAINDFIDTVVLVFPEKDTVISSAGMANMENFFNDLYTLDSINYEQWQNVINMYNARAEVLKPSVLYSNQFPKKVLTYIQTLPSIDQKSHAVLIAFINNDVFASMLRSLQITNNSSIYVLNDRDEVIANINTDNNIARLFNISSDDLKEGTTSREIDIEGNKYLVFYSTSLINSWKYTVVVPKKVVLAKVNYIKSATIILAVFLSIVGLLLSYTMAMRNYNPLAKLIELLKERVMRKDISTDNEYAFLETAVCSILDEEDLLRQQTEQQKPLIRNAYLLKLLDNSLGADEYPYELWQSIGIVFEQSFFLVMLFVLDSIKGMNSAAQHRICQTMCDDRMHIYFADIDGKQKAVILNADKIHRDMIVKLKNALETELNVKSIVGVSRAYNSLREIAEAYKQARIAVNYRWFKDNADIIFIEDVEINEDIYYYYPIVKEEELLNKLRVGNFNAAMDVVNEIIKKNMDDKHLCIGAGRCLMYDLAGTAFKAVNELGLANHIKVDKNWIMELESFSEMKTYLARIYSDICRVIEQKKRSHNDILRESIKRYIDENYNNQGLSLESLAECMGVSVSYLSKFFRDQLGSNFLDYLHRKRIDKAKELLKGQFTVMQIAKMVGYNNDVTFRRVFKKYEGITPGEYNDNDNHSVNIETFSANQV